MSAEHFFRNIDFRLWEEVKREAKSEVEAVGSSGRDPGINTKGRDGSKFAQELNCDAGQTLSQP